MKGCNVVHGMLTDWLLTLFVPLDLLKRASESYFPLFSLNGKFPVGTIAPPLLAEQQLPSLPRLERLCCRSSERPEITIYQL